MTVQTCKDCSKRHQGCHIECEDYKLASEENRKEREHRNAEQDIERTLNMLRSRRRNSIKRMTKN